MKKNQKTLIALASVFVLILALWIIVLLTGRESEVQPPADTAAPTVSDRDYDDVTALRVTSDSENLSFVRHNGIWKLEDQPDFPLDQNTVSEMANAISRLKAHRAMTSSEVDLESAGLRSPRFTVEISYTDGDAFSYYIGNENKTLDGLYLMETYSGKVYLVDSSLADYFNVSRMTLAELDTVPDATAVRKITVSGPSGEKVYESDADGRFSAWQSLEFLAAADFAPDEETLASYSLTEDSRTAVTVEYTVTTQVESSEQSADLKFDTDHTAVIYIGAVCKQSPSYTYASLAGSGLVCLIRTDLASLLTE